MKIIIAKQALEFEEKLKNKGEIKVDKEKKEENQDEKIDEMMKILKNNKELLKQSEELKNIIEVILSQIKELPNLEQKYTDLFDTFKLLQEENNLLK